MRRLILFLLLLCASPAWGAVAYDSTCSGTTGAATTNTLTFSCTNTAGDFMLLILGIQTATTEPSCSAVTYNGVAFATRDSHNMHGDAIHGTEVWHLVAPATGANNLIITCNAATTRIVAGVVNVTGANQGAAPLGTVAYLDSGYDSPPSIVVTSAADELVVAGVVARNDWTSCAAGAGETERWDTRTTAASVNLLGCGYTAAGAATVTVDPTLTGSDDYRSMAGVSIKVAAAAGSADFFTRRRN